MKSIKIMMLLGVMALGNTSCSDMMDINSSRVAFEEDNRLDNANDTIYSLIGILAKAQAVADRCIIMGELRADLMTTDPTFATTDLKEIENFETSSSNKYADKRDFYTIINNCNYAIERMDTAIVEGITQVMKPEYAQIKTIRAWTYLQMALIFGKVNYFTKPLTNIGALEGSYKTMGLDELTATLITDLEPYANERPLSYGSVDGWNSSEFFIPTKMLLGDLYLYNNNYEKAAQSYYGLINERNMTIGTNYANYYTSDTRSDANLSNNAAYKYDIITRLVFDSDLRSFHSQIRHLTYSDKPCLLPASQFVNDMARRNYFHTTNNTAISRYFIGDLRGCVELNSGKILPAAYGPVTMGEATQKTLITKYYNNLNGSESDLLTHRPLTSLAICRPSMLYLRYAEAINRLGKPSIAFAALKYGLNDKTISDTLKVDSNEVKNLPAYINFKSSKFDGNRGVSARGCGLGVQFDTKLYVIPKIATLSDSIEYVENCILQEMAAETCFEGNRFFDLLRISHHRSNHPRLMVGKVAMKPSVGEALRQKLEDIDNWWVK